MNPNIIKQQLAVHYHSNNVPPIVMWAMPWERFLETSEVPNLF